MSKVCWINRNPPQRPQNGCVRTESAVSAVETSALTDTSAIFPDLTLLSRRSTSIHWTAVDYCWWHALRWRLCCCCFSQISFAPSWPTSILRCKRTRCYFLASGHSLLLTCCFIIDRVYLLNEITGRVISLSKRYKHQWDKIGYFISQNVD